MTSRAGPWIRVVIALGSNLGDRLGFLRQGVRALATAVEVDAISPVYASDPVGMVDQPEFLNAVLQGRTTLEPTELLEVIQDAETAARRSRDVPGGPRTLDLDLVFYGNRVVRTCRLQVPHPRWLERAFVRVPLLDVDPEWTDPLSGRTVRDLSTDLPVEGLRRYAEPTALEVVL